MPARLVKHLTLEPYHKAVSAANGTPINIIGHKRLHFKLNGVDFNADMLITNDIDEAMLGISFMMAHECNWQVHKGIITIDHQVLQLYGRKNREIFRRVYCAETTLEPASCHQDVGYASQYQCVTSTTRPTTC
jgi:hypothetical protein